jgi:uncharacterized protein YodC (DUF2158 family)
MAVDACKRGDEAKPLVCYCCGAMTFDSFDFSRISAMAVFKSGDLVVLKSGGPTMTVDTVNTDIFDDDKITGILCAWFVGPTLKRVRFDPGAIQPAVAQEVSRKIPQTEPSLEATEDYNVVLDNMVGAMNTPTDHNPLDPVKATKSASRRRKSAVRADIPKSTH